MTNYEDVDDGRMQRRSPAEMRRETLLEGLTEPQRESVLHRGTPLVILAGAGTGKTTALTRRIAHIIASGDARPEEILAVTFTNKSARELEKRIKKLLDDELSGLTVGTFHAVSARILRDNWHLFGVPQDFVILDSDDQKRLVKRLAKARYGKVDADTIDEMLSLIEDARSDPDDAHNLISKAHEDTRTIYHDYSEAKKQDGVLDFTDLISIITDAFDEGRVRPEDVAGQWTHILVDEYQDTNGLQFKWLLYVTAGKPDLAVVGDDDQVLYSWRGAKIENILSFPDFFKNTKVIKLEQNFRSTGLILDAANGLIAHNKKRMGKTLFTTADKGKPLHVRYFVNAEAEAKWVVDEIKAKIEAGMPATDIAILSRASHVLNLIEQKMTWAGIPYVLSGGKRFQDKAEIRDAMAYLRMASNPDDSSSFDRVVNTPKRGMGEVAIKKIIDAAEKSKKIGAGLTLIDVAENFALSRSLPGDVPEKLRQFVECIRAANQLFWRGANASEVLENVLENSGYMSEMKRVLDEAKSNHEGALAEQTQNRIDSLSDLIKLGKDLNPLQLVEHLGLGEDGRSRNAKGVWIGTIHAAKGLEWPMVIGAGWEENVFPTWQALAEKGDKLAEERRCAYVQVTRAREFMVITTTGERFMKPAIKSRFLSELPIDTYQLFDMQPE